MIHEWSVANQRKSYLTLGDKASKCKLPTEDNSNSNNNNESDGDEETETILSV